MIGEINTENHGTRAGSPVSDCSPVCEKREPCRVREDGDPEFDGTRWESGMHLMTDLCMGRLPEPCWIRCGRTAMKINPGESRVMGRGIMIGYDVTELSLADKQNTHP